MSKVSHNGPWIFVTCNYMYLQNRHFLINIRNQQLYVLAKHTINTLLKLMVKMNTRNWKKGRSNSESPLWRHPFINTIMLILLSQKEQGINALDLQKQFFPSDSSPMSEKIRKISLFFDFLSHCWRVFHVCCDICTLSFQF
jgi:hypothetical protein